MSDRITIVGVIATDPQTVGSDPATQLCTFRLASNDRRYNRDTNEWVSGPTNWYSVNAFRGLGEHAKASLRKGERIVVLGRLRVRNWETQEKRGTSVEVDAEALGHDLRFGTSVFTKLSKPTGDTGEQQSWSGGSAEGGQGAEQPDEHREPALAGAGSSNLDGSEPF